MIAYEIVAPAALADKLHLTLRDRRCAPSRVLLRGHAYCGDPLFAAGCSRRFWGPRTDVRNASTARSNCRINHVYCTNTPSRTHPRPGSPPDHRASKRSRPEPPASCEQDLLTLPCRSGEGLEQTANYPSTADREPALIQSASAYAGKLP